MNIFHLSTSLKESATLHVDKHVVKMRLEMAQLACTAHHMLGSDPNIIPYRASHKNHPCTIWTRESLDNYQYVVLLGLELCNELEYRFNTKEQKCRDVLNWLLLNYPTNIPSIGLTLPPRCMPNECKTQSKDTIEDIIQSYKNSYNTNKIHLHKWTKRDIPHWIKTIY